MMSFFLMIYPQWPLKRRSHQKSHFLIVKSFQSLVINLYLTFRVYRVFYSERSLMWTSIACAWYFKADTKGPFDIATYSHVSHSTHLFKEFGWRWRINSKVIGKDRQIVIKKTNVKVPNIQWQILLKWDSILELFACLEHFHCHSVYARLWGRVVESCVRWKHYGL